MSSTLSEDEVPFLLKEGGNHEDFRERNSKNSFLRLGYARVHGLLLLLHVVFLGLNVICLIFKLSSLRSYIVDNSSKAALEKPFCKLRKI
jgi:hypothetical protein